MIYTKLTCKAMKIAYEAHHGKFDCNGVPYIFHPIHVAEQMTDELTACAALLHDVVEDTSVTFDDLSKVFPEEIISVLKLLTHDKDTDYFEYIRKIKENPQAKAVKLADLAHNSDQSRIVCPENVPEEKRNSWKRKYAKAIEILTSEDQLYKL